MITKSEFLDGMNKYTKKIQPSLESAGNAYTAGNGLKLDGNEFSVVLDDLDTFKGGTYANTVGTAGLVPPPTYPDSIAQIHYLRSDGKWATPTNTTYSAATASTAGLMSSTSYNMVWGSLPIRLGTCDTVTASGALWYEVD